MKFDLTIKGIDLLTLSQITHIINSEINGKPAAALTQTPQVEPELENLELFPEPAVEQPANFARFPEPEVEETDSEFDSSGMPWDDRIHASTKTKKKDGTWKSARGVDAELVKEVEAELRLKTKNSKLPEGAVPVSQYVPPAPVVEQPVQAAPVVEQPVQAAPVVEQPVQAAPVVEQPVQAAPVQAAPVQAAPVQAAPVVDFAGLMQKLQGLLIAGKVQPTFAQTLVTNLNTSFGTQMSSIVDIQNNQPMIDSAYNMLSEIV